MRNIQCLLGIMLVSAACNAIPRTSHKVDNSLLEFVSEESKQEISDLRAQRDATKDELSSANRLVDSSRATLKLAEQEKEVAEIRLKKADLATKIAERGTLEDLRKANEVHAGIQLLLDATKVKIEMRKREVENAESVRDLRRFEVALADARVERVKAEAIARLPRPEAQRLAIEDFRGQERQRHTDVAIANAKVQAAEAEARVAAEKYAQSVSLIPANYKP